MSMITTACPVCCETYTVGVVGSGIHGGHVCPVKVERDRYREALVALLAWIDGWRDLVDGELEERWRVGFTDTTPELRGARAAFDEKQNSSEEDR